MIATPNAAAEARYLAGRTHAAQQEFTRARRCFRDAAEQGHAEAMTELALFALFGIGTPVDLPYAVDMLRKGEAAGSGEASYQLGLLAWTGRLVPYELDTIADRLRLAALRGFPVALRAAALAYRRMAGAGSSGTDATLSALADRCLERAAQLGDGIAAYLRGLTARRAGDADADRWLRLAAARQVNRAVVALGPRTAGDVATPDVAPITALPPIDLSPGPRGQSKVYSTDPLIETFDDVYSVEECEYIIALGEPRLLRSMTIKDDASGLAATDHRRSHDHQFVTFEEDFALRWLQVRMLANIDVPLAQAEHLVLLRYLPGDEYRPHRDYLPPGAPGNVPRPDQPGQRLHTTFSYLADVEAGGETDFPTLGVRIAPKLGRVVHFVNLHADGTPDARTLHAGLPVHAGAKWLATLWTRERTFREY